MEAKPGIKSTELYVTIAALLVTVIPVLMDKVPQDGIWPMILGAILAVATYVAGRSHVKATEAKAKAVEAAAASSATPVVDP